MGGGSSKTTADSLQNKETKVPPFKIVLRRCTDLAKADSNGGASCYIVGRFFDMKANKFLKQEFKSGVREKTAADPEFTEVRRVPAVFVRVSEYSRVCIHWLLACRPVWMRWAARSRACTHCVAFTTTTATTTIIRKMYVVNDLPGLHVRVDLECWGERKKGEKPVFLGLVRIYLGEFDEGFQKYVAHRRDFATIP
jgi:hypothetical protein